MKVALYILLASVSLQAKDGYDFTYSADYRDPQENCKAPLAACKVLIDAQDTQIKHLKEDNGLLLGKLADSTNEESLPTWVYVATGFLAGFVIKGLIK